MRVFVTLLLAAACVATPAWAKGKKKKKAAPAGEAAAGPSAKSRLYVYDAEQPTAPPTVLVLGEGEAPVPEAPLLSLDKSGKAKAAGPAVDKPAPSAH